MLCYISYNILNITYFKCLYQNQNFSDVWKFAVKWLKG